MAFKCDRCGKGIVIASQQRHKKGVAGERWKYRAPKSRKISRPNLQTFRGVLNGKKGKWKLCTKCLRRVKSAKGGSRDWPVVTKGDFTGKLVKKKKKPASKKSPAPKSA